MHRCFDDIWFFCFQFVFFLYFYWLQFAVHMMSPLTFFAFLCTFLTLYIFPLSFHYCFISLGFKWSRRKHWLGHWAIVGKCGRAFIDKHTTYYHGNETFFLFFPFTYRNWHARTYYGTLVGWWAFNIFYFFLFFFYLSYINVWLSCAAGRRGGLASGWWADYPHPAPLFAILSVFYILLFTGCFSREWKQT